jgi:hypothetical protein
VVGISSERYMLEYAPILKNMTYEEALLYCQFCDHKGYNDWRLPTFDECRVYKLYDRFGSMWYKHAYKADSFFLAIKGFTHVNHVVPVRDIC